MVSGMRYLVALMFMSLFGGAITQAQTLETAFVMHAEAGSQFGMASSSRTSPRVHLSPLNIIPDHLDVGVPYPFAAVAPVGHIRRTNSRTTLAFIGAARYQALAGQMDQVQYGFGRLEMVAGLQGRWRWGWASAFQMASSDQVGRLVWDLSTTEQATGLAGLLPDHTRFWANGVLEVLLTEQVSVRLKAGYQRLHTARLGSPHYAFSQMHVNWYQQNGFRIQTSFFTRFRTLTEAVHYGGLLRLQYRLRRMDVQLHIETEQGGLPLLQGRFGEIIERERVVRAVRQHQFWRTGMTGTWQIGPNLELLAQIDLVQPARTFFQNNWHRLHLGTGLRWRLGSQRTARVALAPLWYQEDKTLHFQLTYTQRGTLYLVGDFNNWEAPGIPLEKAGGGLHTTTLVLPPGRYHYKVLRVHNGAQEWLALPPDAFTESDSFGGLNGVFIVDPVHP